MQEAAPTSDAAGEKPIDKALALALEGNLEAALRWIIPVLEAEPRGVVGVFVAAWILCQMERLEAASAGFRIAVERAVEVGNLPMAVAAACQLRELGREFRGCFDAIARGFSYESGRFGDLRSIPPSLIPPAILPHPLLEGVARDALMERVEAAIKRAGIYSESEARPRRVRPHPLLSALDEQSLRRTVEVFEVTLLPAQRVLIEEGTVGEQAFLVARGELEVCKMGARSGANPLTLARLGSGSVVGEMALLSRAPRTATVRAIVPTITLSAHKTDLDRVIASAPAVGQVLGEYCRRRMLDNLLRTNFILRSVSPAERPVLVERFTIRTFEAGQPLVTQGERAEGLYLLALGEVAVFREEEQGRQTQVARLGPGEVVGEVSLVLRRPAIANVIAQHPTVTLFLPESSFLSLARAHPRIFVELYELAVRRTEEMAVLSVTPPGEGDDFVMV